MTDKTRAIGEGGKLVATDGFAQTKEWPGPTPEMLRSEEFEAIWRVIKTWDIKVPGAYNGYMGATGNHVRAIIEGLRERIAERRPDGIDLQNVEFDALNKLTERWKTLQGIAVVDDAYPEHRHKYEGALKTFIEAIRGNGRLK